MVLILRAMVKESNSKTDAHTPQPGEIFFNTMRYRSSETVKGLEYFQSSVSYIKVQIMFNWRKMMSKRKKMKVKMKI